MFNDIRTEARDILEAIRKKAIKADLHYVVIYWMGPISNELNHRVGYFEDVNELLNFKKMLLDYYDNGKFSYYMTSDVTGIKDGGLFDIY